MGIKASKKNSKGDVIADYARENEFGSFGKGVPSRPFLRTTFKGEGKKDLGKRSFKEIKQAVEQDYDAEFAIERIGMQAATMVRKNIRNGNWVPNKPSTLAKKRGSKPLIDTHAMIRAVESWIVKDE